jgi:hypothetical protein
MPEYEQYAFEIATNHRLGAGGTWLLLSLWCRGGIARLWHVPKALGIRRKIFLKSEGLAVTLLSTES